MQISDLKLILLRLISQPLKITRQRKRIYSVLQAVIEKSLDFLNRRAGLIFGAPKFSKLERKKQLKVAAGLALAISLSLILWNTPRWYKTVEFRTRFYTDQKRIEFLSEEEAKKEISGKCDEIRAKDGRLYAPTELPGAINAIAEKQIFVGNGENDSKESSEGNMPRTVINTAGKDIEIKCFEFQGKVVIKGNGKIDFGWNILRDVSGNALYLGDADGKIHHNIIENSTRAGIFAESGNWEISGNIIKNNKSYGVYGSYETNAHLIKNYIGGNSGYEVRLLKNREIYK